MKKMVPSFQYQKLIKIPCTNSKEGHLTHYTGDGSKGFFWFRRLSPCRKCAAIRMQSFFLQNMERCDFHGTRKGLYWLFFACVEDNYNFEPPLLARQFKSLHFAEMRVLCRNSKLMGQGRLHTIDKSLFISYSQLSGCIFPKTFESLGTE